MTKKDFEKFLNENFRELPLDKQEDILIKMRREWIPSILDKRLKKYTKCLNCGKYSLTKRFKIITKIDIREEKIYSDAGYGDDDMFGQVKYLDYYTICPICGNEKKQKSEFISILSESRRK